MRTNPKKLLRGVAALGLVAAISAGVTTIVGADGSSNATGPSRGARAGVQSPAEAAFVPITPCRIIDTRKPGAGGAFDPSETRSFKTQGNTSAQGGAASCGVPASASAVEINTTAVTATGTGFLRLFPSGDAEPNATFMNYTDVFNASNAGTVALTQGTGNNLKIKNYSNSTHVVMDVLGYYVDNLMAVVAAAGTLVRGNHVVDVAKDGTGTYRVNFDRNVSGCAYAGGLHDVGTGFGNEGDLTLATNGDNANGLFVKTFNEAGAAADIEFHVTVTC